VGLVRGEEKSVGIVFSIRESGTDRSTDCREGNRRVRRVGRAFSGRRHSEDVRGDKVGNSFKSVKAVDQEYGGDVVKSSIKSLFASAIKKCMGAP
jgi:hypothetical protein